MFLIETIIIIIEYKMVLIINIIHITIKFYFSVNMLVVILHENYNVLIVLKLFNLLIINMYFRIFVTLLLNIMLYCLSDKMFIINDACWIVITRQSFLF